MLILVHFLNFFQWRAQRGIFRRLQISALESVTPRCYLHVHSTPPKSVRRLKLRRHSFNAEYSAKKEGRRRGMVGRQVATQTDPSPPRGVHCQRNRTPGLLPHRARIWKKEKHTVEKGRNVGRKPLKLTNLFPPRSLHSQGNSPQVFLLIALEHAAEPGGLPVRTADWSVIRCTCKGFSFNFLPCGLLTFANILANTP